jgi:hypothetical protein
MSWQEYSLGLIDALALPGVVLILGILFFRPLRAISRRVQDDLAAGKALQIGAGGIRVSITERDDYQAQWYKPYQLRLATREGVVPEAAAGPTGAAPPHDDDAERTPQLVTPEGTPPTVNPVIEPPGATTAGDAGERHRSTGIEAPAG